MPSIEEPDARIRVPLTATCAAEGEQCEWAKVDGVLAAFCLGHNHFCVAHRALEVLAHGFENGQPGQAGQSRVDVIDRVEPPAEVLGCRQRFREPADEPEHIHAGHTHDGSRIKASEVQRAGDPRLFQDSHESHGGARAALRRRLIARDRLRRATVLEGLEQQRVVARVRTGREGPTGQHEATLGRTAGAVVAAQSHQCRNDARRVRQLLAQRTGAREC